MGFKTGPAPNNEELKIYCFWSTNPEIPVPSPKFFVAKSKSDAIRKAVLLENTVNGLKTTDSINKINFNYENISEYQIKEGEILENEINSMLATIVFKMKE